MKTQLLVEENVTQKNWAKPLSITQAEPDGIQTYDLIQLTCLF
jgi:hypothetical protein